MSQCRQFVRPVARAAALVGALLPGCTSHGPTLGATQQGVLTCPTTPAPKLFDNALCVCTDLHLVGSAVSTRQVGAKAASVGVNGLAHLVGDSRVEGDFVAKAGLAGVGDLSTTGDIRTAGGFDTVGTVHAGKDLWVGGDLAKVGELIVDGVLRLAGSDRSVGERKLGGTGAYSAVAEPCGCDGAGMFDVSKAVADAKSKNDNAKVGLAQALQSVGDSIVELPTGVYYLDSIDAIGRHRLEITGAVALYVGGDIEFVGEQTFALGGTGASLDLYVAGSVHGTGSLALGDAADAGPVRIYIGGPHTVLAQVGEQEYRGLLYAPTANVHWVGETRVRGAIFARSLDGVGDLTIEYDGANLSQPIACNPTTPAPTPGDDQPVFVR